MMKRWGLLGLLALAACGGDDGGDTRSQALLCPGVVAGAVPGEDSSEARLTHSSALVDGRQRFLIRYRDAEGVSASHVSGLGDKVLRVFQRVPAVVARLTPEEREALATDPSVEFIEPDAPRSSLGLSAPVSARVAQQTVRQGSAGEYTPGLHMVEAPWVWDKEQDGILDLGAPTGEGIKVCVIDSGIDPEHPELKGTLLGGKDFVDDDDTPWDGDAKGWGEGHGTHVAGIIAAQLGSGSANVSPDMSANGVVGVAPGARLLIARVLNKEGVAWASDIIAGLEWCQQQGAHVASLSLGGGGESRMEFEAFKSAAAHGMLVIAAAGNTGGPLDYPAAYSSVLAVGAVDQSMRRAPFSAHGGNLSLMAPGVSVLSTIIREQGTISQVEVGDIPYSSRPLYLAPAGRTTGRLVDCGDGASPGSCREATCDGFVAYVDRSDRVPAHVQLTYVMKQGARAVIFGDVAREGDQGVLSIGRRGSWVPGALVSHDMGVSMRRMAGFPAHVKLHKSDYAFSSGTSMAAPHVTGVAALVWSARPSLTAAQVRKLLESTAKDLGAPGKDWDNGYGLVQSSAALEALESLP
ncbi:S8 family serine peptidase [Hyalangium gracile]|uniref:S8 family serine peptidase n=1 Tax=Hyalangium gracile TaxID=394092 RepID=UPI00295E76B3|nr:S8 family serine peptidase [Hyalangium gracile]